MEISEAYAELSRAAFAFWIRMQAATPKELLGGRKKLAKVLRISVRNLKRWTEELARKGYIGNARYRPAVEKFVILRRGIIRAGQEFQRY